MKKLDGKAHWEIAKGTADQNIKYCTKEDTRVAGPWQVGEPMTAGHRSDLDKAASMLDEGKTIRDVAMECKSTFIRYHRGLQAYQNICLAAPRQLMETGPEVWVFCGKTGAGKSHRAWSRWPDAYRKPANGKWWDGYRGQETVIFDDFKGSAMSLHDFQLVVDKYPLDVEFKGGFISLSAKRYVFTSNKMPWEWYSAEADPDGTVVRRIQEFCVEHGRLIICQDRDTDIVASTVFQGCAEVAGNTSPATLEQRPTGQSILDMWPIGQTI